MLSFPVLPEGLRGQQTAFPLAGSRRDDAHIVYAVYRRRELLAKGRMFSELEASLAGRLCGRDVASIPNGNRWVGLVQFDKNHPEI